MNVLIVDDHPASLSTLQQTLSTFDVEILCAESGKQALNLLLKLESLPALVILTVQLQDINGFELADTIRSHPKTRHIPIIFIATSYSAAFASYTTQSAEIDYVITPFAPSILQAKVNILLNLTRCRLEIQSLQKEKQLQSQKMAEQINHIDMQTSELMLQQKHIQKTKMWFSNIIQSLPESVIVVDRAGSIVLCNRRSEEIFGYEAGTLVSVNIDELVPESIRSIHHEKRAYFMATNTNRLLSDERGAIKGVRKDGSEFFAEVSLSTMPNLIGNDMCVCVSVHDVSERFKKIQ